MTTSTTDPHRKSILFVRTVFITGAVLDALFVIPLVSPRLAGLIVLHVDGYQADVMTTYMMNIAAALMAGWAGILFWAAVKPVERRGIIPITLFPLLSGLLAAGVRFYLAGGTSLANIVPLLFVSLVLMIAQGFGYVLMQRAAGATTPRAL
jgi:hypothetical protein